MQDFPVSTPAVVASQALPEPAPARRLRVVPDVPLDFDEVVRALTPRLVRYAQRRLGNHHEAEEVAQEALLRAHQHRAELLTEDDVAAWTTCVTGRLVIDRLRVRGRSTSVADVPEGHRVGRDTADVVVARDEARTALDALDAMPPRQAAVLWAREVEGLAYDEIGLRFGMTEPAVRSILTRARKALRKEFAVRGGTLPAGGLVAIAPWLDGLGWLDRLRRATSRLTAPAALTAGALGIVGGALLLPLLPGDSFTGTTPMPSTVRGTVHDSATAAAAGDAVLHGGPAGVGTPTGPSGGIASTLTQVNHGVSAVTDQLCTEASGTTVSPAGGLVSPIRLPVDLPVGTHGVGGSGCTDDNDQGLVEIAVPSAVPVAGGQGLEVWIPQACPALPDTQPVPNPVTCTSSAPTQTTRNTPAKDAS